MDIHLIEGLLHVLNLRPTALRQIVPVSHERAQPTDVITRTERTTEQTVAMQPLQPLAILAVALAPRHMPNVPGVDQKHFQSRRFELLKEWNPIDRRRFHHHRFSPRTSAATRPVRPNLW